ncbi:unnamed protein product [Cuscuta campestris]|uniref:Homing endonuclease LAGLIDADG domain-containing protein n=1 Tax=Cuscuta campestris TaxID=132261 RepID=A0A484MUH8_9ASTE|nr:unnamed protein product [Cuscuta campestris]
MKNFSRGVLMFSKIYGSGFLVKPRPFQIGASNILAVGNQRHKSSLVGTSDTTPATRYPKSFCEWLAGVIDGDGTLNVNKKGRTSLEITMGLEDIALLRYVQHMLGGSIKMRSGAKSYRYRLIDHLGMIKLMDCINGNIQKSARLTQLHRVCQVNDTPVIVPLRLNAQSNWFGGFFDANGSVDITVKNESPQLHIRVTSKLLQDVEPYKVVFGGNVYFDSGQNGFYEWSVDTREDISKFTGYFKTSTFRSHKSRRFFLIDEYYHLYDLKAFEPSSMNHKAWLAFLKKWNNLAEDCASKTLSLKY